VAALAASPRDAVLFALLTLKEVQLAWNLAYSLGLDSEDVWERLATAYEKVSLAAAALGEANRRGRVTPNSPSARGDRGRSHYVRIRCLLGEPSTLG
jgi:hypothetical protein